MHNRLDKIVFALGLVSTMLASSPAVFSADKVFRSQVAEISFRYPDDWVEKAPQLQSTLVLLYASDESKATCNVGAEIFEQLTGLSEEQIDSYRRANHTREYYENQGKNTDRKINKYWRGYLGQKDAGFVETSNSIVINDKKITVISYVGATFANGRRYTLLCNAPTGQEQSAKAAFDYIRSTMLFMF